MVTAQAADETLLARELRHLDARVEGTPLEGYVQRIHEELGARGIRFRPHVWVSTDFFSPDGVPGIAVPFHLTRPELTRLERRQVLTAEGAGRRDCLRLLRHETGHAIDTAFGLSRRADWRAAFGLRSAPYHRRYTADPSSHAFVRYLPRWYAQSHPAEDFAETFAVWLDPGTRWRTGYAGWPALAKLELVDCMMREVGATRPVVRRRERTEEIGRLRESVASHYRRKRRRLLSEPVAPYEETLRESFDEGRPMALRSSAAAYLVRRRARIVDHAVRRGRADRYAAAQVLDGAIHRARELGLRLRPGRRAPTLATLAGMVDGDAPGARARTLPAESMKKKLRILFLCHEELVPPDSIEGLSDEEISDWRTEFDVLTTLRELGHEALPLGAGDDIDLIRRAALEYEPDLCFNLLVEFHGAATYDQHVVSYLELHKQRYTGCNPRGLTLARDKALSKEILSARGLPVPAFQVFPTGRRVRRRKGVEYPLFVKSVNEEASLGISRASIVRNDAQLEERVGFVHETVGTDAIAEEYIEGREFYVGVMGNERLVSFPIWELCIPNLPEGAPVIATRRMKWDVAYQKRLAVKNRLAEGLEPAIEAEIARVAKSVYRALDLSGYARLDLRMRPDGRFYVLEANPNPDLTYGEDFAESAEAAGVGYEELIQRILRLGMGARAAWEE